jgi:hypothetical protein
MCVPGLKNWRIGFGLMTDLTKLSTEELEELLRAELGGEDFAPLLEAWSANPPNEKERLLLEARGEECRRAGVSEEGYKHLYWCLTKREYPDAHLPILRGLLKAYNNRDKEKPGVMIQAWRGFGKSTDLLVWVLLLLGNHPEKSMAFIRINDVKAQEAGDAIAGIVDDSLSWRACFPHVVPDKDKGWSKKSGFFVQNTDVVSKDGYSKWREICFADHTIEASLICSGVESGLIIGLHPTNGQWFDDLHDEKNTKSASEMKNIVDIFEGNILPAWFSPAGMPTLAVVCTPWDSDNDVYAAMLRTGLFELVKVPLFELDDNGPEFFEPLRSKVRLTWPEEYPMAKVRKIWNANTVKRFYQMFLLDDKLARENAVYKWQPYPGDSVDWNWPIVGGVDPVYTDKKEGAVSHFALCYLLRLPSGGAVIAGGVLEKCSASEGMDYIIRAQNMFKNYMRTWCETPGGNIVFIQMVMMNPGARIVPIEPKEFGSSAKGDRQYNFLEPILKSGYVYVSDADTPFLNTFRNYLAKYPSIADPHAPEWDVADSVVAALYGVPDIRMKAAVVANDGAYQKQLSKTIHNHSRGLKPPRIDWNGWSG